MPQITVADDVVKKIRERLIERTVSAEELADHVGMTYEAMQAVFSGKSAFDNPTLEKIAPFLGFAPEELITDRRGAKEEDSPYFKAVAGGMLGVKRLEGDRDQVNTADACGKYFIEYAVDAKDNKVFQYLLSSRAMPMYPSAGKTRALLRVATGCLRCNLNPDSYLDSFLSEVKKGGFSGAPAEEFLRELESHNRTDLFEKLLDFRVTSVKKVLGPINKSTTSPLFTEEETLVFVSGLHLKTLFSFLLPRLKNPAENCRYLASEGFLDGLKEALEFLKAKDPLYPAALEEKLAACAVKAGREEVLEFLFSLGNADAKNLILLALAEKNDVAAEYLAEKLDEKDAEFVALRAANLDRLSPLKALLRRFKSNGDFYTRAFAVSPGGAGEMNRFLTLRGARFTEHTLSAPEKANFFLQEYINQKTKGEGKL